jgi:hypothetical protein
MEARATEVIVAKVAYRQLFERLNERHTDHRNRKIEILTGAWIVMRDFRTTQRDYGIDH